MLEILFYIYLALTIIGFASFLEFLVGKISNRDK